LKQPNFPDITPVEIRSLMGLPSKKLWGLIVQNFSTGWMPFLPSNQPHQSTEGIKSNMPNRRKIFPKYHLHT